MLGGRSKFEVAVDVLVIATAVVRVLAGLDAIPARHQQAAKCEQRPVRQPERPAHWELRRLPPCDERDPR